MAVRAVRGRECRPCRGVHWIIRLLPSREVTLRIAAVGRRNVQRVVSVDVALAALDSRVLVGKGETGRTVVKLAVSPCGDRMAGGTGGSGGRETCRDVIRHVAAQGRRTLPR